MPVNSRKPLGLMEKEYIASGEWKCPDSPTGGHWWNCNVHPIVCKICKKVQVPTQTP